MGVTTDKYARILCPLIMKSMPMHLTLAFRRHQSQSKGSLSDIDALVNYIKEEVESREGLELLYEDKKGTTQPAQQRRYPSSTTT